jgi:hypothetical protein
LESSATEEKSKEKGDRAQRRRDTKKHGNRPFAGDGHRVKKEKIAWGGHKPIGDRRREDEEDLDEGHKIALSKLEAYLNESSIKSKSKDLGDGYGTDELPTAPMEPMNFSGFIKKYGPPSTPEKWTDKPTPELRKKGQEWSDALNAARKYHDEWKKKVEESGRGATDDEGKSTVPNFSGKP